MDATQRHISAIADEGSHVSAKPASSKQSSRSREALKDIAFGSIAGIVGKYIEYPFDTVKVRLQSQSDSQALRYRGPLDCFRQSFQQDGIRGFYRGISAPLVGAALETSSLFFSYRLAQSALQATIYTDRPLTIPALVACGGASGAFTSILLTPIELVKCKMQVPHYSSGSSTGAPGVLDLIRSIHRHQGLSGFWHGQMGTLIRETGGSAAWFGSYEALSAAFRPLRSPATETENTGTVALPIWQQMVAGAIAGMSYNLVFYPADTIKSRMQTEKLGLPGSRKETFLVVGKALWRQQGLAGFYRGCGITVARAAPSSAFIFTVYEALRAWFG